MTYSSQKRDAFTLIEMIIAITVFTIFIGFAVSTYLTFHRADQDALTTRSMTMEGEAILSELSDAVRENKIDYAAYEVMSGGGGAFTGVGARGLTVPTLSIGDALNESMLYLVSADGEERRVYTWDSEEETLSVQYFDADGKSMAEPQVLHSESVKVSYVNFKIFPGRNPYENRTEDALQFQPMVGFSLEFTSEGRMDKELTFELQTTVTSRFYQ